MADTGAVQLWTNRRIGDKLVELGNGLHSLKMDIADLEDRMCERFDNVDERASLLALETRGRFDALEKIVVEIRDSLNGRG